MTSIPHSFFVKKKKEWNYKSAVITVWNGCKFNTKVGLSGIRVDLVAKSAQTILRVFVFLVGKVFHV